MPASKPNSLALTCGEGISAEITEKAWAQLKNSDSPFFVVGNPDTFADSKTISAPEEAASIFKQKLPVLPIEGDGAKLALRSLELATELTYQGKAQALVTNPVNKARLAQVGFRHRGQTEFIAERAGGRTKPVMMLATATMRCALVTTHLPLRQVPDALTQEKIILAGKILQKELKERFAIAAPKIAVAALNPHGGEDGLLGDEEKNIIAPACRALGAGFTAPLPADTMFLRKDVDAFLCLYHDQALIAIKMQTEPAVNITLGLPIVRTSPDHGTAFDILGKNIARADSLIAAIKRAKSFVS